MSFLGNALMAKMAERDWSQTELAAKTDNHVTQGQISRFLAGEHPKRESAETLFAVFGQEDGAELLRAWLKDCTPVSQQHWVTILPEGRSVIREEPDALADLKERLERMPPRARKIFSDLAKAVDAHPSILNAVETMLELTQPPGDRDT